MQNMPSKYFIFLCLIEVYFHVQIKVRLSATTFITFNLYVYNVMFISKIEHSIKSLKL